MIPLVNKQWKTLHDRYRIKLFIFIIYQSLKFLFGIFGMSTTSLASTLDASLMGDVESDIFRTSIHKCQNIDDCNLSGSLQFCTE